MVQRCKNCGEKVIKNPMWKGQEKGEPFSFDKIIWLNLFKTDMMSVIWFVVVIFLILSYRADMEQAMEIIENPLKYCEESNACKIIEERKGTGPYGTMNLDDIPDFNITDS